MRRIILDVDTGHDDAVAIALAAGLKDEIKIEGIIAVAGNQTRDKTLNNTLNMAEALDLDCPVFYGAKGPLLREQIKAGFIHGESGFDGHHFPPRKKQEVKGNGIEWALKTVIDNPGEITYVSVGPWTDLALMIKSDERFVPSLKEIVLMGGAVDVPGNITPSAEFNVYADPEAASIVMSSGAPITMMGLDVTLQVLLTQEIVERFKREVKGEKYREVFLDSMDFYIASCLKYGHDSPAMHDPCTIMYLVAPEVFEFESRPIYVETKGDKTYGKTLKLWSDENNKTKFGIKADVEKFWDVFFKAIKTLP